MLAELKNRVDPEGPAPQKRKPDARDEGQHDIHAGDDGEVFEPAVVHGREIDRLPREFIDPDERTD